MARADDDGVPSAGPIPGVGQIELLDPGDSRNLTRTFRLKRPPASAPAGSAPSSPDASMTTTLPESASLATTMRGFLPPDAAPPPLATTTPGLAPSSVAPPSPGEPTTRFFSRAELLGRARGLSEAGPLAPPVAPFVPVLSPPRLAPEARPPSGTPTVAPAATAVREPYRSVTEPAAVPELPRSSSGESPISLPYLRRLPFSLRSRRVRVGVVKGIAAVAALAVGGWMVLRPIPTTSHAISSASAAVPPRVTVPAPPRVASAERARIASPALPAPATIGIPSDPSVTPRAAADAVAEGRYADALRLYRGLAAAEPGQNAYGDAARILEARLAPQAP